jgi:hypothetical protein
MAAGVVIKHKRKAGAFIDGELVAGEMGLDVTTSTWYFSINGTTVQVLTTGSGDMLKSVYDSNDDGKVNAAAAADVVPWSGVSGKPTLGTASGLDTGTSNGNVPLIGAGNKLPSAIIPAVAITSTQTAVSQAAQLALTTEEGDVVIRTDLGKTYIRNAGTSGTMSDFTEMPAVGVIVSVNGQTGVIVLGKTDVGLGNVANVDQTNAGNISAGDLASARMVTNLLAALNALAAGSMTNANLTIDGGTI